ncbi:MULTISPECIES: YibE/F family protein [Bacillaceae]|uniref:YibE/F family protein n=1 Tax=Evansella alkalicola TaxID=745819 RepID=A0ABS6JXU8_9BACI|nr:MULTISPECIES: YibE/F family protein [Bacillaceae]MBU9723220.1 YibE/F family protein [Bacillus alkalicola]
MKKLKNLSSIHYIYVIVAILFGASFLFVNNNYFLYEDPIAKVIETSHVDTTEAIDSFGNEDQLYTQHITGLIKNGDHQGNLIHLTNQYSMSGAYDHKFNVGNDLFVSIHSDNLENGEFTGSIREVKRDKYVLVVAWIFIFALLLVGKKQGLFSLISLLVNAIILSFILDIYIGTTGLSLVFLCILSAVFFTITSLLFVNGFNEKTYSAIIATLLATLITMIITYLTLWVTSSNGLYYEAMQFLTRPPQTVFLAGILIGSLGAVMDVAITISSSLFNLYEKNTNISTKALLSSGMEIGKDIMGTMTNILFFVYVSGTIPVIILYFKNHSMLGYTLSINLSLELARAIAGGIGIVLTIPIGLYITVGFINRKRVRS